LMWEISGATVVVALPRDAETMGAAVIAQVSLFVSYSLDAIQQTKEWYILSAPRIVKANTQKTKANANAKAKRETPYQHHFDKDLPEDSNNGPHATL
jgi:hypothetical protein